MPGSRKYYKEHFELVSASGTKLSLACEDSCSAPARGENHCGKTLNKKTASVLKRLGATFPEAPKYTDVTIYRKLPNGTMASDKVLRQVGAKKVQ